MNEQIIILGITDAHWYLDLFGFQVQAILKNRKYVWLIKRG